MHLRVVFRKRREPHQEEPQREAFIEEVRRLLLGFEEDKLISPGTAIAVTYVVQFIVLAKPMPAFIERRWREVGVLNKDGLPNEAMRKWGEGSVSEKRTEGVLGMILAILGDLFENWNTVGSEVYHKGEITV